MRIPEGAVPHPTNPLYNPEDDGYENVEKRFYGTESFNGVPYIDWRGLDNGKE